MTKDKTKIQTTAIIFSKAVIIFEDSFRRVLLTQLSNNLASPTYAVDKTT